MMFTRWQAHLEETGRYPDPVLVLIWVGVAVFCVAAWGLVILGLSSLLS